MEHLIWYKTAQHESMSDIKDLKNTLQKIFPTLLVQEIVRLAFIFFKFGF